MSFSAVGQVFDFPAFRQHVGRQNLSWARGVCLHHTGTPDLAQRPQGFKIQHMRNFAHYYGNELGWSAGPHLFVDEDQVFGLSPLTARGVHAVSFNREYIGIEALGNYNRESSTDGRGAEVWHTATAAAAILLHRMGRPANGATVRFHRDDPRTSKTCPGANVDKQVTLEAIRLHLAELDVTDDRIDEEADPAPFPEWIDQLSPCLDAIDWQLRKIRKILPG